MCLICVYRGILATSSAQHPKSHLEIKTCPFFSIFSFILRVANFVTINSGVHGWSTGVYILMVEEHGCILMVGEQGCTHGWSTVVYTHGKKTGVSSWLKNRSVYSWLENRGALMVGEQGVYSW